MCARRTTKQKSKKILFSDNFYSDMTAPEMLYAVTVRSPYASGKINLIGQDSQEKLPQGYTLITAEDIPGAKSISSMGIEIPVLCEGNIKYKGETVALIAGPDPKVLENLAAKIRIVCAENTVKNEDSSPETILAEKQIEFGNIEEAFADSEKTEFVDEHLWKNSVSFHENKETEGCFCQVKAGILYIYSPSYWITNFRSSISSITGFAPENIIFNRTKLFTKNTNSLWLDVIIAAQAAITSIKTGKPVMLKLSRTEQKFYVESSAPVEISYKTGLNSEGKITALSAEIAIHAGAFNILSEEILNRFMIASCGCYTPENLKVKAVMYSSSVFPKSVDLATIDSQVFFALENQMQAICEKTSFTPLELRLKNLNLAVSQKKSNFPFIHSFGRATDVLSSICRISDFNRKHAVYRLSENNILNNNENSPYSPPLRGAGLACAYDGSGFLGTNFNNRNFNFQATLTEDKKLILAAIPPSNSIREIWIKKITDELDIEKKNILFDYEDDTVLGEQKKQDTIPEILFGNISIKTHLLLKCISALKKKKPEELPATVKKSLSTARRNSWDKENFRGVPFFSTAFGACTVEVEFDPCSYREKINSVHIIIDSGKILNVKAAENTVRQSIQKCLSTLAAEECLKSTKITVQFATSEDEPKQLGHLVQSILPAAYSSAISQSIGKTLNYLPIQTDSLYRLRTEQKKQEEQNENSTDSE